MPTKPLCGSALRSRFLRQTSCFSGKTRGHSASVLPLCAHERATYHRADSELHSLHNRWIVDDGGRGSTWRFRPSKSQTASGKPPKCCRLWKIKFFVIMNAGHFPFRECNWNHALGQKLVVKLSKIELVAQLLSLCCQQSFNLLLSGYVVHAVSRLAKVDFKIVAGQIGIHEGYVRHHELNGLLH